ncbi:MAG: type 4a pilus biogenesis protein PilO [Phycisphaerales bacterium JB037]
MRFGLRELVLVAVLIAVPVASFFLVFKPQNEAIEAKAAEIEHKEQMLEQLTRESQRSVDLETENARLADKIAEFESRLPNNKGVDLIVGQVSELAMRSGMGAPAMKNAKPIKAALYWEQPLELKVSGTPEGAYRFMQAIERLPRITRVPDLKMTWDKDRMVEMEFTLSIYFQDEGGAP